ncbi:hypothetical protein [Arthrobacter citreus]
MPTGVRVPAAAAAAAAAAIVLAGCSGDAMPAPAEPSSPGLALPRIP